MSDSDEILFDDIYELHEVIGKAYSAMMILSFYNSFYSFLLLGTKYHCTEMFPREEIQPFSHRN